MSTRVAPSSPPATAKANGEASSGPPADGHYGTQRFFGEESCFAVVVCWPAIPLVVPLLLICGLDTRTVWRAADGTMWEVRARHAQRGDPLLFHVRRVAAARDTLACMHRARGTARLPPPAAPPVSSSLARCSPSRHIVFACHRSPLSSCDTHGESSATRRPSWRLAATRRRLVLARSALTLPSPPLPQSADPGAKQITSRFDVSNFGKGRRYQSASGRARVAAQEDSDAEGDGPAEGAAGVRVAAAGVRVAAASAPIPEAMEPT